MLAVLKLEYIAENYYAYQRKASSSHRSSEGYGDYLGKDKSRPWVAHITGLDTTYGLAREFMEAQIDYSQANPVGSRGVYLYYPLKDGIYEVNERRTWRDVRRYFIRVEEAKIQEITREEVEKWLNKD